nr:hypothetical protein [Tanacetum cinerariifolium]
MMTGNLLSPSRKAYSRWGGRLGIGALTGATIGSETGVSDWVTGGWTCAVLCGLVVCTGSFVAPVPCLTTLDGVGMVGPLYATPLRVVIPFRSSLGFVTVLPLALNIPQDCVISFDISFKISLRHILRLRNWGLISRSLIDLGSMKLALVESRLVEIAPSVLSKIIPSVGVVLIILNRRESGRSDLVRNHLRMETGVSLIIIG